MVYEHVIKKCEKDILKKKNVVGIAEGEKWVDGKCTSIPAILVLVTCKKEEKKLRKKDRVDKQIDGVATDVVNIGEIEVQGIFTSRMRPVQPGYSCSHPKVTAGTLGGIFLDKNDKVVGLSNNHVLANTAIMPIRGGYRSTLGVPICQPGTLDRGSRCDTIGKLYKYRPLKRRYHQDSALCTFDDNRDLILELPEIGKIVGFNDDVKVGDRIRKSGRTTGYTEAKVVAVGATIKVNFGTRNRRRILTFTNQIVTGYMSEGGDSGSVGVDDENNAIGLLFAGSNRSTIFNPIRYPRRSYGLKIIK